MSSFWSWMKRSLAILDSGSVSGIVASIENVARRAVAALVSRSHRKSQVIQSLDPSATNQTHVAGKEVWSQYCSSALNSSLSSQGWVSFFEVSLILFGCWFYFSTTLPGQSRPHSCKFSMILSRLWSLMK